jgi:hypothetical protein
LTPEPDPLTNAYWKVERAKLHLHDLTQAVSEFCADSHVITVSEEPEHDRVTYRVQLKQPHVYIYLIFGDLFQCLRTALDQAVWSLIYHRDGTDSEGSEFLRRRLPAQGKASRIQHSTVCLDGLKSTNPLRQTLRGASHRSMQREYSALTMPSPALVRDDGSDR